MARKANPFKSYMAIMKDDSVWDGGYSVARADDVRGERYYIFNGYMALDIDARIFHQYIDKGLTLEDKDCVHYINGEAEEGITTNPLKFFERTFGYDEAAVVPFEWFCDEKLAIIVTNADALNAMDRLVFVKSRFTDAIRSIMEDFAVYARRPVEGVRFEGMFDYTSVRVLVMPRRVGQFPLGIANAIENEYRR